MTTTRPRRNGQALVEFAMVVPLFLLLVFGIIDVGRYVFTANAFSNGTREGARAASVGIRPAPLCNGLSRTDCAEAVVQSRSWGVPASNIDAEATCWRAPEGSTTLVAVSGSTCRRNDLLRVRATTEFTLVTPIVAQFLGSQTIAAETQVTVQQ